MYLDSAILVKLIVREPDSRYFARLVEGQIDVWSSELAITECWSALFRKFRDGSLDVATRNAAWRHFNAYLQSGGLRLEPVSPPVFRIANRMIAQCAGQPAIRTLDALHLATCELRGAYPLQTTDRVMRAAAAALGIPLGPLP